MDKKQLRARFRQSVFERDGFRCAMCGLQHDAAAWQHEPFPLDAHHITDRNELPHGGYVAENGISLCKPCHEWAELEHAKGVPAEGYGRADLYARIGSNYLDAVKASLELGPRRADFWPTIERLLSAEAAIVQGEARSAASWELACEQWSIEDVDVLNFGRYRVFERTEDEAV